jgi:hypothetical protein
VQYILTSAAWATMAQLDDAHAVTAMQAFAHWLANYQHDPIGKLARISVTDLLAYSGTPKHHKGGYRRKDKLTAARRFNDLSNFWVKGRGFEVTETDEKGRKHRVMTTPEGRFFVISSRVRQDSLTGAVANGGSRAKTSALVASSTNQALNDHQRVRRIVLLDGESRSRLEDEARQEELVGARQREPGARGQGLERHPLWHEGLGPRGRLLGDGTRLGGQRKKSEQHDNRECKERPEPTHDEPPDSHRRPPRRAAATALISSVRTQGASRAVTCFSRSNGELFSVGSVRRCPCESRLSAHAGKTRPCSAHSRSMLS